MAPSQSIQVLDPLSWPRSTMTEFALHELENGGQLAPNVEGQPPAWIVPPAVDREPNPSFGYVVSFIHHHKRGFAAPASRIMRGRHPERNLAGCHLHRRVRGVPGDPGELRSLGPPLPRGAAHALYTRAAGALPGARMRGVYFAAGVMQGILHSLYDDFQQRGIGAGVVLPLQQRSRPPPTPARF
jgi:hypothetical protein